MELRSGTIPESLLEILESSQKSMEEEVTVASNAVPPLGNSSQTASATGHVAGESRGLRAPPRIEIGLHIQVLVESMTSWTHDHMSSLVIQ